MARLLTTVKNLLRWAQTSLPMQDSGQFPIQQVTYLGKTGDLAVWQPYGYHSSAPPSQIVLMLSMQGNTDARIGIPGSPQDRPRPLIEGEVVIYHPKTGSKLFFREGGSIEIVTSTNVKIDAPEVQLTGNVQIDGTLDVIGDTTLSGVVTSNSKDISDTHTHSAGTYLGDGGPAIGPVTGNSGAPV